MPPGASRLPPGELEICPVSAPAKGTPPPGAPTAMTMEREASEEAPSAPESASTSTATTEVFHSPARAHRYSGKHGEADAFQHLCDLVNVGVERRTMRSVLRNAHLRKFFGGVDSDDPALIRAYLDAKRGMKPPAPTSEKDSP